MFCFVLTSPPLMLCVYLQTFEAALFWKKKRKKKDNYIIVIFYYFNDRSHVFQWFPRCQFARQHARTYKDINNNQTISLILSTLKHNILP